ncbi:M48 family metalloprotease [Rhodoferax sp. TBRC 17660]|uniref:M48 family metalloprotease n=1 Tax=Rhodoferax potami TaxID=3068338 RepID=A0ABU3KMW5_9BURK|nr:M48 family metalloprotease [Rhodoferax sp. TBRC 17660]MDT7519091.1 M48 family metalloprotease [Rhodoferax sp. TBRC 17660]
MSGLKYHLSHLSMRLNFWLQFKSLWALYFLGCSALAGQDMSLREDLTSLSVVHERLLGDRIARDLYRDPDFLDDAAIADYLHSIWQHLMNAARQRGDIPAEVDAGFAWKLLQGKDRTVNAFALPGGYFGIHLGLVGVVSSKDELASVLAHELSHVTQRHIARLIRRQSEQTPLLVGAMILGALAASTNPAGANAVIVGGQAVAAQSQLNFSRDMEREADRAGFEVATKAGFSPVAFVSMFEKLQLTNRNNDAGSFPYLRSHPLTTERIADMKSRIPDGVDKVPSGSLEHSMVSARARLLSNASVDGLRYWYSEAESAALSKLTPYQRVGALYGSMLASIKLRDFGRAVGYRDALRLLVANDDAGMRQWRYVSAELALAEGRPAAALEALAQKASPKTRAELLMWVGIQIQLGSADAAADAAQLWVLEHPLDASMWQALASARAAQGRTVAAVRAEAEVNFAQLDYAGAIARLKAAQELSKSKLAPVDHIEASIVDVRLRQVEQLLREQAIER